MFKLLVLSDKCCNIDKFKIVYNFIHCAPVISPEITGTRLQTVKDNVHARSLTRCARAGNAVQDA